VANARQQCGKNVFRATDTDETIKEAVFSMRSVLRLYNEEQLDKRRNRET
jgi:hypothetical protein